MGALLEDLAESLERLLADLAALSPAIQDPNDRSLLDQGRGCLSEARRDASSAAEMLRLLKQAAGTGEADEIARTTPLASLDTISTDSRN